jgi:hypothetical protein
VSHPEINVNQGGTGNIQHNYFNFPQSEKFTHDQSFYNNLGDREIDHQGNF